MLLYERNPHFKVASRAFLHTTQLEVSRFFANKFEPKKLTIVPITGLIAKGVIDCWVEILGYLVLELAQALQQIPASGHSFALQLYPNFCLRP